MNSAGPHSTAGIFVTGTDTGVGKTLVCAELLRAAARRGWRCAGMKPVASGATPGAAGLRNDDALALWQASGGSAAYELVNPYCFAPAIAPHIAAREAGVTIDLDHIASCAKLLAQQCDWLVVEGVGGWRAPLGDRLSVSDLALRLQLPVLLVVGIRLGCLNHALLTLESINRSGLPFAGWIGSQIDAEMPRVAENLASLSQLLKGAPLAILPWQPDAGMLQWQMSAAVEALASGL